MNYNYIDNSIIIPEHLLSDNEQNINKVEIKDNSKLLSGSLVVYWNLQNYKPTDKLALYQHDRLHDYNYIYSVNLTSNNGYYTFTSLVDGFYDVRIINDKNIRYENIYIPVCCIGKEVIFETILINNVNNNNDYPILQIKIPIKYIKSNNDCIALFDKNEHSNKIIKSYMYDYIYNGTDNNNFKIITFKLKYIYGSFVIKYFYYDSMSIINGNVYSGLNYIDIQNYDNLRLEIDLSFDKIKIYWNLYTIDSNINQWIGVYNEDNLIDYQYINKHKYLNSSKTKGIVIFDNKKLYEEFYKIYVNNFDNNDEFNKAINLYTIKLVNINLLFKSNVIITRTLKELLLKKNY